jgi:hypothetical protein
MAGAVELDTSTHSVFIASIAHTSRTAGRSSARWSWGAAGEEEMELGASSAGTKEQGKTLKIEAERAETTEQVLVSREGMADGHSTASMVGKRRGPSRESNRY